MELATGTRGMSIRHRGQKKPKYFLIDSLSLNDRLTNVNELVGICETSTSAFYPSDRRMRATGSLISPQTDDYLSESVILDRSRACRVTDVNETFTSNNFLFAPSIEPLGGIFSKAYGEDVFRNYHKHYQGFHQAIEEYSEDLEVSIQDAIVCFSRIAMKLSIIPFLGTSTQILSDGDGFKIVFKLSDERLLFITKFFSTKDFDEDDIVYSLFQNRENVLSDVVNIGSFINEFMKYLTK